MTIETLVAIVVPLLALGFTAMNFRRTVNHDTESSAIERATMLSDIRYIRTSIDDIKVESKAIRQDVDGLREKLVVVEQSAKSAHKRLDDLTGGRK